MLYTCSVEIDTDLTFYLLGEINKVKKVNPNLGITYEENSIENLTVFLGSNEITDDLSDKYLEYLEKKFYYHWLEMGFKTF